MDQTRAREKCGHRHHLRKWNNPRHRFNGRNKPGIFHPHPRGRDRGGEKRHHPHPSNERPTVGVTAWMEQAESERVSAHCALALISIRGIVRTGWKATFLPWSLRCSAPMWIPASKALCGFGFIFNPRGRGRAWGLGDGRVGRP